MFPVSVSKSESGVLMIEGKGNAAILFKGQVSIISPNLKNNVILDSQTGYLFIQNLRTGDSGKYVIEYMEESETKRNHFQLTVYEEVPKPQVTLYDRSSCTWMCSVENGRDVTLAWYEENVLLNQTSNPDSNISLSLHLKTGNHSRYECVAANPAINRTSHLLNSTILQDCTVSPASDTHHSFDITVICVAVLSVVCIILIGGVVLYLRKSRTQYTEAQSTNEELRNEVQYSEILHSSSRLRQASGQHISELGVEGEESSLTSVYAKVQPHPSKATGKDNTGTGSGSTVLDHL